MKRLTRLAAMAGMMVAVLTMTPGVSEAGRKKTDHALLCRGSCAVNDDFAIYCGLRKAGKPYNLHISGSTASGFAAGEIRITFLDGDFIRFNVPDGESFSITQALGGVPDVDDVVKITATGGVETMMVSLHAKKGGKDPFDETLDGGTARKDNYCVTSPCSSGSTTAEALFGDTGTAPACI